MKVTIQNKENQEGEEGGQKVDRTTPEEKVKRNEKASAPGAVRLPLAPIKVEKALY